MAGKRRPSRSLFLVSVLLGGFVLFDLVLFGWLIFRSLSQKEVDRVMLEARAEARGLAEQLSDRLSQEEDLYTGIAKEQEIQTYIDSVLKQRDIVTTVEIRDKEGQLVFRSRTETEIPADPGEGLRLEPRELPVTVETKEINRELPLDLSDLNEPIGDVGFVHIGISLPEVERRIEALRGELIRQTSLIAAVTLIVLALAYLAIWKLWRRGQRLEEKAVEAERLAYVGTLASGLAHEIRNPLNSLSLNMQMLEEEPALHRMSGSTKRLLGITRSEINRLERLVTDFLQYAKPRPLELAAVPAGELLRGCHELLENEFRSAGAEVLVEDRSAGALVEVDRERLIQLLLNLAQNALAASVEESAALEVHLIARREGDRVLLEVLDNGAGIPADEVEKVFDLFYSTRKGGTGLGLAVVKRIAENHGGEVKIQSSEGVGTRVQVFLPEVRDAAAASALEPVPAETPSPVGG